MKSVDNVCGCVNSGMEAERYACAPDIVVDSFRQEVLNQQQMFLKMVPDMRQEVSQEIKYLMRITVEMSLEQES